MLKYYQSLLEANKIKPDPAQQAVAERLARLHAEMIEYQKPKKLLRRTPEKPRGLYIYGKVGRGKSMLMDLFYSSAELTSKERHHFHEFMHGIHRSMHALRKSKAQDPVKHVAQEFSEHKLLCLDEYEVNDVTDAMILSKLFREMAELGVVFVMTSNKRPEEHYKDGLQRQAYLEFCKYLEGEADIISLDSPHDYRLLQEGEADNFVVPSGYEATQKMKERLKNMTGQHLDVIKLDVLGRKVEMRAAGKIGWAEFDDLCGEALGTPDYLKLAESFEVLFLENIPKMTEELRNEARRFISLIDILYENKTLLIASAEVEIEGLYAGGKTASFEFNRTVSRLKEMRGWS